MHAQPGDWLVIEQASLDHEPRKGLITEVHSTDGSPPYVVRWLDSDHVATVFPGPDAIVVTALEQKAADERPNRRIASVHPGITHHFKSEQ